MTQAYDLIVIGLGAAGSATAYHLAKRGQRVLGLDIFEPGHNQGSSHGYHRLIRRSAVHDDGYVPLGERAFTLWQALSDEAGRPLIHLNGEVHLIDSAVYPNFEARINHMRQRGFWEILDQQALTDRFPGFQLQEGMIATYEATAGYILAEGGVIAHLDLAKQHGATLHHSEEVTGWTADGAGVKVTTKQGSYTADQLVITTGSWAPELLGDLHLPIRVIRTVNGYFAPTRPDYWAVANGAPNFLLTVREGEFYGMAAVEGVGVKIGRNRLIDGPATTPRTIRRTIDEEEITYLRNVLDTYMPGSAGPELQRITCLEGYTGDDHFILGRHPQYQQVLIGCGFCGRGFKFAPTSGEILADLATTGTTAFEIAALDPQRFVAQAAD